MYLLNAGYQKVTHRAYRADGSLSNTSPKLILPQAFSRAFLSIQNLTAGALYLEHGCARATATISGGAVNSTTILNGGFGFTRVPHVEFKGGGGHILTALTASAWDGRGQIDEWPTPSGVNLLVTPPIYWRPARGHAVLTAGVVTSIVVDDPGYGYANAPEVLLMNDPLDPFGCADPSVNSGSGALIGESGGNYYVNGTFCHTDAVALYSSGGAASYYVEYAP